MAKMNHVLCATQVAKIFLGLLTFLCCRCMNLTNLGYCVLSISTLKMNNSWSLQNNFDIDTSDCIGSSWNFDWMHTMKSSNLLSMSFEYVILLPFILLNMNYAVLLILPSTRSPNSATPLKNPGLSLEVHSLKSSSSFVLRPMYTSKEV